MQAAVIETPGEPPTVRERPAPEPADGEVLVTVAAAPITPLDRLCASGTSYFGVPRVPYVPGVQGVGVDAGGRPVWFATPAGMAPGDGSMRERAAAPEGDIVALPDGADPVLVAALGLSAVAAHMALGWRGGLAPGERVLVLGAGGIVGQSAVQLARTAGAARVVAAARSAADRDRALDLGADAVVALEDTDDVPGLAERMRTACDGDVDLVLDPLFGVPAAAALRALRPGGRLVNLGSSAAETAPIDSATLRSRSLRILGYTNNELTPQLRRDALEHVVREAVAGRLTVAHERVPLADAPRAWSRRGRVVLVPQEVA
jgi:NADPH:quinone reductase-like Zn-dependent oxidoreductase